VTRALSDADRDQLRRERLEADRRYNDALTALDASLLTEVPPAPPKVAPIDSALLTRVNDRWRVGDGHPELGAGWRARLGRFVWRIVGPVMQRQQHFNIAIVEHLNGSAAADRQARETLNAMNATLAEQLSANVRFQSRLIQFLQQVTAYVDTKDREHAAAVLADPHEQIRRIESALGAVQQRELVLKRELERAFPSAAVPPGDDRGARLQPSDDRSARLQPSGGGDRINAYKYLHFEQQFRGSEETITGRLAAYVPLFAAARDVLDVGCGRGEFLELLRAAGVTARGVELNHEMAEVCRARGLEVDERDCVSYLESLEDGALGGLFAGQVVEHLEPGYLMRFLELAYHKLRPGSKIVLETINVDYWSAFFGPYLRDITHVRPLPSSTLAFLLEASGFQRIDIRASAPVPESEKLQPLTARAALPDDTRPLVDAFNGNVEKLNAMLFTHFDYAAIGEKV